jgi:hypothetical protein
MKPRVRALIRFVGMVTVTTAALCGLQETAMAADGGRVYFFGGIVAPQFIVSTVDEATSPSARMTTRVGLDASAVMVAFKGPPGIASGADVALLVNDGAASRFGEAAFDTIETRFVGGAGQSLALGAGGRYRVGGDGGVLSLREKTGDVPSANKPVTVVVSYD